MSRTAPSDPVPCGARHGKNRRLAYGLIAFAAIMVALSFASVPLYRMFCAATGFGGTPRQANVPSNQIAQETVIVRFDANVSQGLPWSFEPVQNALIVRIGENELAFFRVKNLSAETVTGSAVFNVSPELMGQYFTKVQCFCFSEQTLKPGETAEMAVSFFIDPKILDDHDAKTVRDMTLSYTFFKSQKSAAAGTSRSPRSAIDAVPRRDASHG